MSLTPDLVLQRTDFWINAAIFQGTRLARLLEAQGDPMDWTAEQWRAHNDANRLGTDHLTEEAESAFFVIATRNVLRWLPKAVDVSPALKASVNTFSTAAEHVIDLRNMMSEHEDAYLAGKGRDQGRYVHKAGAWDVSAHGTLVGDNAYLIGGRLEFSALLAALRSLLPEVERSRAAETG